MSNTNNGSTFQQYRAAVERISAGKGDDRDSLIVFLWKKVNEVVAEKLVADEATAQAQRKIISLQHDLDLQCSRAVGDVKITSALDRFGLKHAKAIQSDSAAKH